MRKIFMIFVIGVSGCAYWKDLGERHKLWELNQINQSGLVIPATCDGVYGELLKGYRVMEYDKKNNTRSDFTYFGQPFYYWGLPNSLSAYLNVMGDRDKVFNIYDERVGIVVKSINICRSGWLGNAKEQIRETLEWQLETWRVYMEASIEDAAKKEDEKKRKRAEEERARQAAKEAQRLKLHNELAQKFGTITVTDTIPSRVRQSLRKFINAGGGYDDSILIEERRYLKQFNTLPKCTREMFLSSLLSSMAWEMLIDDYAAFGLEMMGFSGDRGKADMYNALIYSGAIANNCKPEFFYK